MADTWDLTLPWLRPPLSLNAQGGSRWPRVRTADKMKAAVTVLARYHRLPTGLDKISVEFHYQPVTDRRRDEDNLTPNLKPCIDALVAHGVVSDDNHRHVTSRVVIHEPAPGTTERVWIHIEKVAA